MDKMNKENHFVVLTPVFNCEDTIERTLYSITGQTYKNWSMIIIDDMSTDNTISVVNDFISRNRVQEKISVISRDEKFGETRNTVDVVKKLHPEDIVVRVDASDFITDLGCFELLNPVYNDCDPAAVWTKHRWSFTENNISAPLDINISVYNQPWVSSHMKTFRVRDFWGINEDNFKDEQGNWIMIACDQAIFLPLLERARINRRPLAYWDRTMYHYDIDVKDKNLFKHDRSLIQRQSAEMIRKRGYIG